MALYAGLAPQDALQRWVQTRNAVLQRYGVDPSQLSGGIPPQVIQQMAPEDQMALSMTQLAQENPEAFRLVATGTNRTDQTHQNFNPVTGQYDTVENKGWFSHPESWLQLGLGGAMGAGAAAALAGGAASGAAASGGAASGVGGGAAGTAGTLGAIEGGAFGLPASSVAMLPGAAAVPGAAGATTGASILGKVMSSPYLKNAMGVGQAVSAASSAAGNTRRADTDTNVGAQAAYNNALLGRAALEDKQRNAALRDVYAAGYFRDMPRSPYNPAPVRGVSQNYLNTLGGLEQQGMQRLAQPTQYGTNQMSPLNPYATRAGTLERAGNWAGPALSVLGSVYGQRPTTSYGTPPFTPRY